MASIEDRPWARSSASVNSPTWLKAKRRPVHSNCAELHRKTVSVLRVLQSREYREVVLVLLHTTYSLRPCLWTKMRLLAELGAHGESFDPTVSLRTELERQLKHSEEAQIHFPLHRFA